MLKLSWVEIFLRLIPETLIIILGIHIVSKHDINMKKYIVSSIVIGLSTFIFRSLPIYFGVHTFLTIFFIIFVMVTIGIPVKKSIYSTLFMFIILSLSELVNILILDFLNINIDSKFHSAVIKSLFGIPSLIIMGIMLEMFYYISRRREKLKDVIN